MEVEEAKKKKAETIKICFVDWQQISLTVGWECEKESTPTAATEGGVVTEN